MSTDTPPTRPQPDWTPQRRARLEACAEHLLCNALNLEADTLPGEMNEDLYRRVAADQKQWTEDLRAALAEIARLTTENEGLRGSISWIEPPFITDATTKAEIRQRIGFVLADVERATIRAAASARGEGSGR